MNEHENGRRMARYLDDGMADLPPAVVQRLERARMAALSRMSEIETVATAPVLTGGGAGRDVSRDSGSHSRSFLMTGFFLLAMLLAIYLWQESASPPETEDLDLLADELPINAYLDKGFHQWISGSLQQ
ncbi:MAG: DUF3619 family protein [Betaproteobacteria bacterium]|nr:DUF3619 family protein [Betaproteobacteria bacterium]